MATGSRARKVTNGISNKKHWKKCIFNDDGLLTLLKYINTHLEDFRNNRWKAYKACAEMMPQDPRSKERYTERHLNSKVSHLLLENMKREFEVKDNRGRLFFTYGSQVLDLQVGFWYNKANGSVLSAQLESSLPTGISSPRETQRESAERHREQKRCPPADAVNTITNTNPLRIAIDQHSMGEARILRPYDLWEIGFDGGPDRFSSLSKDWTDNGLRNAMRELLGGINNMVIACSCTNTPGPDYQNLDKQNSALVRLYKKVLGDDDDKRPFGEIIADKAIKAMAREDWLKSLIAAAVTMQVLQVDVPAVCYEQNTFCKALDTVLSLDPNMVTFKQQLYRETKRRIVSTPEFVTTEIVQRAQAMGYDLAYALLPLLVPPSPDHSILVSGNAGQPLHIHQTWKENRANIYRKCLALKAQLCHSEESLRFVWPTTGMLFQRWWMKTEHNNGPAKNVKCHVAVALLPALVSDEKVFPVKEGQGSLEYCLVRRNEWVYSRAVVILNDAESGYH